MPKVKAPTPRFILRTQQEKKRPTSIIMYFHYMGKRLKYATGEKCAPEAWSKGRAKTTGKFASNTDLNKFLNDLEALTIQIYRETRGQLTPDEFKERLDIKLGFVNAVEVGPTAPTLFQFIDSFIEKRRKEPTAKANTLKAYPTTKSHLEQYQAATGSKVDFDTVDYKFIEDFRDWLFEKKGYRINNVAKTMKTFKLFLNEAQKTGKREGWTVENVFEHYTLKDFNIKEIDTHEIALTLDEIKRIAEVDLSNDEGLDKVRDIFLFGCFTGLRIGDLLRVDPNHIITEGGKKRLIIVTGKTKAQVKIPLIPYLEGVLKKHDFTIPSMAEPTINEYIKKVCDLAGINETIVTWDSQNGKIVEFFIQKHKKVTTHTARRSFITNFLLLGVPLNTIRIIVGHSTEKQTLKYARISGELAARQFEKDMDLITITPEIEHLFA